MVAIFDIRAVSSASPALLGIQTSSALAHDANTSFASLFNREFAPELPFTPIEQQDFQKVHLDTDLHLLALLALGSVPQQSFFQAGTETLSQDVPIKDNFPLHLFPSLLQQSDLSNISGNQLIDTALLSENEELIEQSLLLLKNAATGGEISTSEMLLADSNTENIQDTSSQTTDMWRKAYVFFADALQRESIAVASITDGNMQTTLQAEPNGMATAIIETPEHSTTSSQQSSLPTITIPSADDLVWERSIGNNSIQALLQEYQGEGETIQLLTLKLNEEDKPFFTGMLSNSKAGTPFDVTGANSVFQHLPEPNIMAMSNSGASTIAELALLAQKQRFLSALKKNVPEAEPVFHDKAGQQVHYTTTEQTVFTRQDTIMSDENSEGIAPESKSSVTIATPSIWELATKKEQLLENIVATNNRGAQNTDQQPTITAGQYSAATIALGERAAADKKTADSRKYATAFGIVAGHTTSIGERTDIHPIHDAESIKKDIAKEEAEKFTEQEAEFQQQSMDAEVAISFIQPEIVHTAVNADISFIPEIQIHGATPEKAITTEQQAQKLYTGETSLPRMYPADLPATVVAALRTKPQGGVLRLALNPSELGNITLRVSVQNGNVHIRMLVETPEAKAVMEERVEAMKETLRAIGLECDTIEVRQREESESEASAPRILNSATEQQGEQGRESGTQYREHKEYLKTMKTLWNLHNNSSEQQRILRRA